MDINQNATKDQTSTRAALEAAFEKVEAEFVKEEQQEPVVNEPEVKDDLEVKDDDLEIKDDDTESKDEELESKDTKDTKDTKDAKEEDDKDTDPAPEPQAKKAKEKAPQSWKPETREHWNALPDNVRQEIVRRETEIQNTLRETAEQRRFAEEVAKVAAPYEAMLKAEGATPVTALNALLNTAYVLRTASSADKAALIAGMIHQYGVNVEDLGKAMSGQPNIDPEKKELQTRLQHMERQIQEFRQAPIQQQEQMVQDEISRFASDASNEFFEDVRHDMAVLLQGGRAQNLQEAYDMACWARPDIRKVMQTRAQGNDLNRKRQASASVAGGPRGSSPTRTQNDHKDLRSALEAAWESSPDRL